MWTRQKRRRFAVRRLVLPFVAMGVCAYFAHHATHGPNGWSAREARLAKRDALRVELAALQTERKRAAQRTKLLNGTVIERDVLDERARDLLGLSRGDEIILMMPRG